MSKVFKISQVKRDEEGGKLGGKLYVLQSIEADAEDILNYAGELQRILGSVDPSKLQKVKDSTGRALRSIEILRESLEEYDE